MKAGAKTSGFLVFTDRMYEALEVFQFLFALLIQPESFYTTKWKFDVGQYAGKGGLASVFIKGEHFSQ